ncbi:hypothetical protein IMY05_C4489000100 [Salix suchowensis]|nr:hypothetical protein IMY05_C4489000100 [Salix suchowensis]
MSLTQSHWQPHSLTYRSWESYDGEYASVWNDWWNRSDKEDLLQAGKVVDLASLTKSDLARTLGKLYIREHYVRLYARLCDLATARGGVVLSGQPGAGKTTTSSFFCSRSCQRRARDFLANQTVKLAARLPEQSDSERDLSINKAVSKWGWAPRDIIKYLQGQDKELEDDLTDALGALTSSQLFLRLKDRQGNSYNELSHILISSYASASYASATMEDTIVLDFKSLYIAHRVRQQLDILHRDDTLRFIGHCREHRESTALAGWAFENFVLEALTNSDHNDDLFTPIPAAPSPYHPRAGRQRFLRLRKPFIR